MKNLKISLIINFILVVSLIAIFLLCRMNEQSSSSINTLIEEENAFLSKKIDSLQLQKTKTDSILKNYEKELDSLENLSTTDNPYQYLPSNNVVSEFTRRFGNY